MTNTPKEIQEILQPYLNLTWTHMNGKPIVEEEPIKSLELWAYNKGIKAIGEDEEDGIDGKPIGPNTRQEERNELRANQRLAARKEFNITEEK